MFQTPLQCRVVTASLVLLSLATATLFAGPVISFDPQAAGVRLVQKADVPGKVASQFLVKAKGAREVSKVSTLVVGVLLQATARPDDSLKSLPIDLSYRLKGEYDAVLCATIGNNKVTSDVPAWVWAVAAKFSKHDATGAVTLPDRPQTRDEKKFTLRWRGKNGAGKRLLWARYHPAVDDTLMGFLLMTADVMLADPEQMRNLTNGLTDFERYAGYSTAMDRVKSVRAARTLDIIFTLETKPGDHVMLNDVDETFVFTITGGQLRISGVPNYHFSRRTQTGELKQVDRLATICRKNRHLFLDTNPLVYQAVADFSKLVAFFNYIDETAPDRLDAFVNELQPVFDRIPTMITPIAVPVIAR